MLVALGQQGQLSLPVPCCAAGGGAVKGGARTLKTGYCRTTSDVI